MVDTSDPYDTDIEGDLEAGRWKMEVLLQRWKMELF
jgi:hypothetical protein